ncbi:hypothetical protein U1Q18_018060 [Sarracenia purpurea var. burkii]
MVTQLASSWTAPNPELLLATQIEISARRRSRLEREREGSDAGVEERRHGWRNISLATLARSVGSSPRFRCIRAKSEGGVGPVLGSSDSAELQRVPSCRRYSVGSPDLVELWLVGFRLLTSSCHLPPNWAWGGPHRWWCSGEGVPWAMPSTVKEMHDGAMVVDQTGFGSRDPSSSLFSSLRFFFSPLTVLALFLLSRLRLICAKCKY